MAWQKKSYSDIMTAMTCERKPTATLSSLASNSNPKLLEHESAPDSDPVFTFAESFPQNELDGIISNRLKRPIPHRGRFEFKGTVDYNGYHKCGNTPFYVDGQYAFYLTFHEYDKALPYFIGVISMNTGCKMLWWLKDEIYDKVANIKEPIIVQLQGSSPDSPNIEKAREIASSFYWERTLVDIVSIWTKKLQSPKLFILPGEHNLYVADIDEADCVPVPYDHNELLKRRYNGTAKKMGFKKDQTTGLYVLNL